MAEADWTVLTGALSTASCKRGVTAGVARPNSVVPGNNGFIYGFNTLDASEGASGIFCNLANFAPLAKGGYMTACIQRGAGGGPINFAPFMFMGLQGPAVGDRGYLLGIGDGDPSHLILRKGAISGGLPDVAPSLVLPLNQGVLRRSTETFALGTWLHLKLDIVVNLNGDVHINVFRNDLAANPLGGAPVWVAIPGMTEFIDDALAVNSGDAPFTSGRAGIGFWTKDVTRRGYFDHIELYRQQ
jgi:hypothetical protein